MTNLCKQVVTRYEKTAADYAEAKAEFAEQVLANPRWALDTRGSEVVAKQTEFSLLQEAYDFEARLRAAEDWNASSADLKIREFLLYKKEQLRDQVTEAVYWGVSTCPFSNGVSYATRKGMVAFIRFVDRVC